MGAKNWPARPPSPWVNGIRLHKKGRNSKPEIEILVSKTGEVTIEVKGAGGHGCVDLTRALEEALGSVESRSCKTEFYEQAEAGEQVQQRGI